jgi:hypothetical protein
MRKCLKNLADSSGFPVEIVCKRLLCYAYLSTNSLLWSDILECVRKRMNRWEVFIWLKEGFVKVDLFDCDVCNTKFRDCMLRHVFNSGILVNPYLIFGDLTGTVKPAYEGLHAIHEIVTRPPVPDCGIADCKSKSIKVPRDKSVSRAHIYFNDVVLDLEFFVR